MTERYPFILFFARCGYGVALLVAVVPLAATLVVMGPGLAGFVVGGTLGATSFVVLKSAFELVHLITDMLLPK